jgi:dihydroxy-acid dehydratase
VKTGDRIVIDIPRKKLDIMVSATELKARAKGWTPRKNKFPTGVLGKYAKLVQGAETGAITNPL